MNKHLDINKITNLLIKLNIWSIVFFVPVFFAFLIKTNNVFDLNKMVLFKTLVLSLLLFSVLKYIFYGKVIKPSLFWEKIKKNKYIVAILFLYLTSLFISTFSSSFFEKSFYGSYERQLGFEAFLFFYLFSIFAFYNMQNKNDFFNILKTLVFSMFFVSFYAIIQSFGFDPMLWIESTELRAVSTLGQPNFLGAFLLLTIPLNIYFLKESKKLTRFFYLLFLFTGILALGFTYSISSWIGGGFSFLALLLIYFLKNKRYLKIKYKNWFILSILFIIIPFLFISNSTVFKTKLSSVINFEGGSTAARISFWKAGISAIKERPLLGHGPDTQREVLAKYYETSWGEHSNVGVMPDRAHNIFLDILLTTGVLGLISYLILLSLFFGIIFQNIKQKKYPSLNIIIAISFASYLVSLLFNFTFVVSEIIFWLYFAIILKIHFLGDEDYREEVESTNQKTRQAKLKIFFKIIIAIILAYFLLGKMETEINKIIADKYFLDIRQARLNDEYFKALVLHDYIGDLDLKTNIYDIKFGQILAEWTPNIEEYGKIYHIKGAEYMLKIYDNIKGNEYEENLSRAMILSLLSSDNDNYLDEAENNLQSLIQDYPGLPRNYYNLGLFYFHNERYDEAEEILNRALERVPEIDNKNLNYDHLQKVKEERFMNLMLIGDVKEKKGDFDIAINIYEKAGQLLEKPITFYRLANVYKKKDDFNKAIWYNERSIELGEDNHIWYYYLAETYFESGDYEGSLSELNKALEIFPYHSESISLKQEIEEKWKK